MTWILLPAVLFIVTLTFRLLYMLFRLHYRNAVTTEKYRKAKETSERYSGEINRHWLKYFREYGAVPDQTKVDALQRLAEIYGLTNERGKKCDTHS